MRLGESLERVKEIKEEDDARNDWIITPFPSFTPTEPHDESDFHLVQERSTDGYTVRLMSMDLFLTPPAPASGNILVVLKHDSSRDKSEKVRVVFDNPLNIWMAGHRVGEVELGSDYVEFTTDEWKETESIELNIQRGVNIKRVTIMRPPSRPELSTPAPIKRTYLLFDGNIRFPQRVTPNRQHLEPERNFQGGDQLAFNYFYKAIGPNPVQVFAGSQSIYLEPDAGDDTQQKIVEEFKKRIAREWKARPQLAKNYTLMHEGDNGQRLGNFPGIVPCEPVAPRTCERTR